MKTKKGTAEGKDKAQEAINKFKKFVNDNVDKLTLHPLAVGIFVVSDSEMNCGVDVVGSSRSIGIAIAHIMDKNPEILPTVLAELERKQAERGVKSGKLKPYIMSNQGGNA